MLLQIFNQIPDHRRAQARQYDLPHVLLFTVLAILSGADSYRKVELFMAEHFVFLKKTFNLTWKKAPGYTTIRNIIIGLDPKEVEKAFRKYSKKIAKLNPQEYALISMDGKAVKGSFDHFHDQRMIQIFSAFLKGQDIILAHEKIDKKTNEIPIAQQLVKELGIGKCIFTLDALHCQKKH